MLDWEWTVVSAVAYRLTSKIRQVQAAAEYEMQLTQLGKQTQADSILEKYGLESLPQNQALNTVAHSPSKLCT